MIAIVDSGSTKSKWVFIDKNHEHYEFKTVGFNPYYQDSEEIYNTILRDLIPQIPGHENVEEIHFYAAGCERQSQREIVKEGVGRAFPKALVHVDHDMIGACRALFGNRPGIACIAGTGANTCYYDGEKMVENVYSPGLSLADEGSGGYLGKSLARDYVRGALPEAMMKKFEAFTTDRTPDILDKVYKKPFPNRYLASLAPFVVQNQDNPYIFQLAYDSFDEMFRRCIMRYPKHKEVPIRFIGSIAAHLRTVLDKVASDKGLKVDHVVADPMPGLIEFHTKKVVG